MARRRRTTPAATVSDLHSAWRDSQLATKHELVLEFPDRQRLRLLESRRLYHLYGGGTAVDLDPRWRRLGEDPNDLGPLTPVEIAELVELRRLAARRPLARELSITFAPGHEFA